MSRTRLPSAPMCSCMPMPWPRSAVAVGVRPDPVVGDLVLAGPHAELDEGAGDDVAIGGAGTADEVVGAVASPRCRAWPRALRRRRRGRSRCGCPRRRSRRSRRRRSRPGPSGSPGRAPRSPSPPISSPRPALLASISIVGSAGTGARGLHRARLRIALDRHRVRQHRQVGDQRDRVRAGARDVELDRVVIGLLVGGPRSRAAASRRSHR